MRVSLNRLAERDLDDIADFIAEDSPRRALSFTAGLRRACQELATYPLRFPKLQHPGNQDIRRCVHGAYSIFYRIREESIEVLRILHGARDHEAILFPEA